MFFLRISTFLYFWIFEILTTIFSRNISPISLKMPCSRNLQNCFVNSFCNSNEFFCQFFVNFSVMLLEIIENSWFPVILYHFLENIFWDIFLAISLDFFAIYLRISPAFFLVPSASHLEIKVTMTLKLQWHCLLISFEISTRFKNFSRFF